MWFFFQVPVECRVSGAFSLKSWSLLTHLGEVLVATHLGEVLVENDGSAGGSAVLECLPLRLEGVQITCHRVSH